MSVITKKQSPAERLVGVESQITRLESDLLTAEATYRQSLLADAPNKGALAQQVESIRRQLQEAEDLAFAVRGAVVDEANRDLEAAQAKRYAERQAALQELVEAGKIFDECLDALFVASGRLRRAIESAFPVVSQDEAQTLGYAKHALKGCVLSHIIDLESVRPEKISPRLIRPEKA